MDAICRTCFKDSEKFIHVFALAAPKSFPKYQIANLIEMFSSTKVKDDDNLPQYVCAQCSESLKSALIFKTKCEETYAYLLQNYINVEDDSILSKFEEEAEERMKCDTNQTSMPVVIEKYKESKKETEFPCLLCAKVFNHRYIMKRHMRTHEETKSYFCDICQKHYKNEKHHKWIHRAGKRFNCDSCGGLFYTKRALADHKVTHSNVRVKFSCDIADCGKQFTTPNGLNYHKSAAHSKDAMKWICDICSKTFTVRNNLKVHMSYHNTEKLYKCRYCNSSYKNLRLRSQHEKRMHSESTPHQKVKCSTCDKEYSLKTHLTRHMKLIHPAEQLQD